MGGQSESSFTSTTTIFPIPAPRNQPMSSSPHRSLRSVKGRINLRPSVPVPSASHTLDTIDRSDPSQVLTVLNGKESLGGRTTTGRTFDLTSPEDNEQHALSLRSRLGDRGITPGQSSALLAPQASTSAFERLSKYSELSSKERRRKRREKYYSPLPPTPAEETTGDLSPNNEPAHYDRLVTRDAASLASSSITNVSSGSNWVSSKETLKEAEKYRPEEIYSHLHRLAEREISKTGNGSTDTESTLSPPTSPALVGAVPAIVQSRQYRDKLSEMLSGISNGAKVYHAIVKDEPQVVKLVKSVLVSAQDKRAALALKGHDAEFFMDALQDVLDHFAESEELRHDARQLLIDLSKASTNLPESMFIVGVEPVRDRNAHGGTFGDVYRSSYEGKPVALKRLRIFQPAERSKVYRKFCKEALIWQRLSCQFVLPFLGIDAENFPRQPCMVSPWMVNGTINQFLKKNPKVNIDKLLFEIAQGVNHLHSQNIVHGDIKGGNILIDEGWQPRLADFGLTIFADGTRQNTTDQGGTLRWMAPELLYTMRGVDNFKRTFASDMYAYGCLCVELYTGQVPFADIRSEIMVLEEVLKGNRPRRPSGSNAMTDSLWVLIKACWNQDSDSRPKSREVVDHLKHILRQSATDPSASPSLSQWELSKIHSSSSLTNNRPISLFGQILTPEEVRNREHFDHEAALYRCLKRIRRHADPGRMYHDLKVLRQNFSVNLSVASVKDTNSKVTIKQLEISKLKEKTLSRLVDEFHDMRFLHHPNLINYIDLFQYEDQVWVVLDDVNGLLYLRKAVAANLSRDLGLKETFIGTVLLNVGQAVHYLHRHRICHGNINAEQVLLSYDWRRKTGKLVLVRLKLCAMIADPDSVPRTRKRAPGSGSNTEARLQSDIWDLGMLAVEMFDSTGSLDLESDHFLDEMAASSPPPSRSLLEFIRRATKEIASERPSIMELLKDPFLTR